MMNLRSVEYLTLCVGTAALCGCAGLNDVGLTLFSTPMGAYAVIDEQLLRGTLLLHPDHSGTLNISTEAADPNNRTISCGGRMTYTSTTTGRIDLRCSNGTVADMQVAMNGETKGYAYAQGLATPASLAFGMGNTSTKAFLLSPASQQLIERDDVLVMVPK